jgi:ATP/maltotriose-dependent transcriptional regulator MalT
MTKKHKPQHKSKELYYMEGWRDALHTAIVQIDEYKYQRMNAMAGQPENALQDYLFRQILKMLDILREEGEIRK